MIEPFLRSQMEPVIRRYRRLLRRRGLAVCWGAGALLGFAFLLLYYLTDWSSALTLPFLGIAVGTATAVRNLPDSSLIVRMTRGRAWIAVLGVLLVGIVGLNVVTLSLAANAGHIDQNIMALDEESSFLRSRDAQLSGASRIRHDAAGLGLSAAALDQVGSVQASPDDAKIAAQRLAAAGTAY